MLYRMSLQTSVLVRGVHTELFVQPFADRILVLVTQMGKVGNLIQASIPSTADLHAHTSDPRNTLPSPPSAIQLTPIFGSAASADMQPLYSLYAAQIATLVWLTTGDNSRSVVVGIALHSSKSHEELGGEQETFHRVMEALRTMLEP